MANLNRDNSETPTVRERLLFEAAELIVGQRQEDYGTPQENFNRIAQLWTIHIERILLPGAKLSARQIAEMMVLLKLARTINSPTEDSYKDAAGYAGIAGELADDEARLRAETELKKTNPWPNTINVENIQNDPKAMADRIIARQSGWIQDR